MQELDSVRIFLKSMGEIPLLTHEEEINATRRYQAYRKLEGLRSAKTEQANSTLARYDRVLKVRDCEFTKKGFKISFSKWADLIGISVRELKEIIADGQTQLSIAAGVSLNQLIEIEKDGLKAKSLLIKSNIRLVVSIAKKYLNRGLELLDLIQEGTIGMNRGIEKFDPSKGYRFSTYAYWWIRQSITRAIAEKGRTIRLPIYISENICKVRKTRKALVAEGRAVTVEVIATELNITTEKVKTAISSDPKVLSTDVKIGNNQDNRAIDIMASSEPSPEELLEQRMLAEIIPTLLLKLDEQERKVVSLRYGLVSEPVSIIKIGQMLNLSRERIRQIELKAMRKLRCACNQYQGIREILA